MEKIIGRRIIHEIDRIVSSMQAYELAIYHFVCVPIKPFEIPTAVWMEYTLISTFLPLKIFRYALFKPLVTVDDRTTKYAFLLLAFFWFDAI